MRKPFLLAASFAALALLGGCASSLTGDTYSRDEARTVQTVRMGTIEALRPVKIEGTKTPIGAGAGAVIGGVAGSSVGGGRGSAVAAVIGAVAGGLLGAMTEEGLTRTQGVEITVREDGERLFNGCLPTLIQWGKPEATEPLRLHPRNSLPRSGVTLQSITISHPSGPKLQAAYGAIGLEGVDIETGAANITATLQTPKGLVQIQSLGI